jgi:hypothetical protein
VVLLCVTFPGQPCRARGEGARRAAGNSMNLLAAQLGAAFLAPRAGRGPHGNEENPISAR